MPEVNQFRAALNGSYSITDLVPGLLPAEVNIPLVQTLILKQDPRFLVSSGHSTNAINELSLFSDEEPMLIRDLLRCANKCP